MDGAVSLKRITILGVPVDILPPEELEELVASLEDGKNHQIVLLSLWDLMRARRKGEYRTMIAGADLVIPISLSIIKAARFLRRTEPVRYMPFDFVVKLLGALERKGKSAYLLGSTRGSLQRAEVNLKATFPGLRIVGRFSGHYPRHLEPSIVEAIRKATPSLLLVGSGVPARERWIPRNLPKFNAGIYLWCSNLFEIFADVRRKPPRKLFDRGLEWLPYLGLHPWKLYRGFIFAWFNLLLVVERLRSR